MRLPLGGGARIIRGSIRLSVSPWSVFVGCSLVMGVNREHGSRSNEVEPECGFGKVEDVEAVAGAGALDGIEHFV